MLSVAANIAVRVLLAPACAACEDILTRPLAGPICETCWREVPRLAAPTCVRCGDALVEWRRDGPLCARCRRQPSRLTIARSAGRYDGSLRHIVHAFKYQGRRVLAAPLAAMLRETGGDLLTGADAVIPVPLHPFRAIERGFNQSDDLARELGLPVWRVLRRVRHGPPQASLPAARRNANVRAAFTLAWRCRLAPRVGAANRLRNRVVVLIDDVMTTGATLEACCVPLVEAGVRSVRALTVARAAAGRLVQPPRPLRPLPASRR
ncbi:MAG TPA: ComF family protein [Vicinamibacterales bacterium]|nr:ComF family protein [Vicinamibacterales bacterium]